MMGSLRARRGGQGTSSIGIKGRFPVTRVTRATKDSIFLRHAYAWRGWEHGTGAASETRELCAAYREHGDAVLGR